VRPRPGLRTLRVAWAILRHGLAHLARRPWGDPAPPRFRRLLEDLGGAYLKFGQLLALQPDILPARYCDALFDLLDRLPPFPYADVERTFREDHGRSPADIFERFEPSPFAAASIGQVHRALHGGRPVAVKVRRPDVEGVFEADLRLFERVARVIESLRLRRLEWLSRLIEELCIWTREELDYRFEARYMGALAFNARDNPGEAVPEAVPELTTRRILVARYLDGPTVLEYMRFQQAGARDEAMRRRLAALDFDPDVFARNLVKNFVRDAFRHGLFHADLHPANVLVLPGSVVGYVDFGITGALSTHSRRNIVAMVLALIRGDADQMREHYLRLAPVRPWSDVPAYAQGLRRLFDEWFAGGDGERRLRASFTTVMVDLLRLSRHTFLLPSPDAIRYMRSIIMIDGLIGRFAPRFDVRRCLEEVLVQQMETDLVRSWLSPEALLDWGTTGARLLLCAPEALTLLLPQETADGNGRAHRPPSGRREARAAWFAVLGSAALVLAALGGGPAGLGWNVFTAELAVGGLGALGFVLTARGPA